MNKTLLNRFLVPHSGNLKSKSGPADENPKWVGLFALVIAFVGLVGVVEAQPKKVFRIGYLSAADPNTESPRSEAVRLALRDLGYIEGQNIAIEYRYVEGNAIGSRACGRDGASHR